METERKENPWDRSLRGVNEFIEGLARKLPIYRSLRTAFRGRLEGMVDWEQAREIANMVAQSEPAAEPAGTAVVSDFEAMMVRSKELVGEYSHLDPKEPLGPLRVFDRPDWIEANLASFQLIFEPLAESYGKTLQRLEEQRNRPMRMGRRFTSGLLTVQLGMVIGYLARSVLGQFDLGLPRPEDGGKLYIVYPNLLKAEGKLRLVPEDFRLWITLHEVTHAFEFAANPWIRKYLRSLM